MGHRHVITAMLLLTSTGDSVSEATNNNGSPEAGGVPVFVLGLTLLSGIVGGFVMVFCVLFICRCCRSFGLPPARPESATDLKRQEASGAISSLMASSSPSASTLQGATVEVRARPDLAEETPKVATKLGRASLLMCCLRSPHADVGALHRLRAFRQRHFNYARHPRLAWLLRLWHRLPRFVGPLQQSAGAATRSDRADPCRSTVHLSPSHNDVYLGEEASIKKVSKVAHLEERATVKTHLIPERSKGHQKRIYQSQRTSSGEMSKQHRHNGKLLQASAHSSGTNFERQKSTMTGTPSDMLVTESFNSLEHVPGYIDARLSYVNAVLSAANCGGSHAELGSKSLMKRRSQFVESRGRSALPDAPDDGHHMPTANDSFEQDWQLKNEAHEVQKLENLLCNLSRKSPNRSLTGVSSITNARTVDSNGSKRRPHELLDESAVLKKSKDTFGPLETAQEPKDKQVQKWLDVTAQHYCVKAKKSSRMSPSGEPQTSEFHSRPNKCSLDSEASLDEFQQRLRLARHQANLHMHQLDSQERRASGLSTESPQVLVPSLTLDSSEGLCPMELSDYAAERMCMNLPPGYILRRHSDNPCTSTDRDPNDSVARYGVYSLERADTCDGFPCAVTMDSLSPTQNCGVDSLSPGASRERSASSQWPIGERACQPSANGASGPQLISQPSKARSGTNTPSQADQQQGRRGQLTRMANRRTLSGGTLFVQPASRRNKLSPQLPGQAVERRYSSHLKPLDAQWVNRHSHSMEAMVPPLARQNRLNAANKCFSSMHGGIDQQQSSNGRALRNSWLRHYAAECNGGSNYGPMRCVGPVKGYVHSSAGATPRMRHPYFMSQGASLTKIRHALCPGVGYPMAQERVLPGRRSVPASPHVPIYYPSHASLLNTPSGVEAPVGAREIQSFEFDWPLTANKRQLPLRHSLFMHHQYHSAGVSGQNSFGSEATNSPQVLRKHLQSMRTSSSSTNSIMLNGPAPTQQPQGQSQQQSQAQPTQSATLLNPPDLVFSPASRRVSAVDQTQNDIDGLSCGLSMKNLFRQSNVYDEDEAYSNAAANKSDSADDAAGHPGAPVAQNFFRSAMSLHRRTHRSSSQNLEDASAAPAESYYHRPLPKHRSTGNFSFEYGGVRSGAQSPRYVPSPLEQSEDLAQQFGKESTDFEPPPSPAPDMCSSLMLEDAMEHLSSWQLFQTNPTEFRSRGLMLQPSLGPVIDASDESTSDGRSGSQNTEKQKLANSDQSSLNVTQLSSPSSHEFRRKSFANIQRQQGRALRTTTDTSFEDSFDYEQETGGVEEGKALEVMRPRLAHAASMEARDREKKEGQEDTRRGASEEKPLRAQSAVTLLVKGSSGKTVQPARNSTSRLGAELSFTRDYSIDEKTDILFNSFLRDDPAYDAKVTAGPSNAGLSGKRAKSQSKSPTHT